MCTLCTAAYDYLSNFHAQAAELSLSRLDFPVEKLGPKASQGEIVAAVLNPFVSATTILFTTEPFLRRLEAMKLGEVAYRMRWQSLPLTQRQDVNELLPKVERAKEMGWWSLPETYRQDAVKRNRDREAMAITGVTGTRGGAPA